MSRRPATRRYRTIDAHAAGEPLRLIVEGYPTPAGRTMSEKRSWAKRYADSIRKALMLEPRGHADMYGAVLTEPVTAGADAGVLFMHNEGYSTMCGHGIIAVPTVIASIYGMNVHLPFQDTDYAFALVMGIAIAMSILLVLIFIRKKYF